MSGSIKTDVQRKEYAVINVAVKKEICEDFKRHCKKYNYPMNLMLELFMKQFTDKDIIVDVDKAKEENKSAEKTSILNTTINADIHQNFKMYCKKNGCKMKDVITGFMIKINNGNFVIRIKETNE